jgi:hypothetical protein
VGTMETSTGTSAQSGLVRKMPGPSRGTLAQDAFGLPGREQPRLKPLVFQGKSSATIASQLGIAPKLPNRQSAPLSLVISAIRILRQHRTGWLLQSA